MGSNYVVREVIQIERKWHQIEADGVFDAARVAADNPPTSERTVVVSKTVDVE